MSEDFKLKAELSCGAIVSIVQPGRSQTLELTITPAEGTRIEDTAWIKDGSLRVNATIPALAGMFQLLGLIFNSAKHKRKRFFGWF